MHIPDVAVYGPYHGNYGIHSLKFSFPTPAGSIMVWFSYKTMVAFAINGDRVVRKNEWGTTTGKHLSAIDGNSQSAKAKRLPEKEFLAAFAAATAQPKPKAVRVKKVKPTPPEKLRPLAGVSELRLK